MDVWVVLDFSLRVDSPQSSSEKEVNQVEDLTLLGSVDSVSVIGLLWVLSEEWLTIAWLRYWHELIHELISV